MSSINQWLKIVSFFAGLFFSNAIAAQSVAFQVGKQQFVIPAFVEDTVTGYDNYFVKAGILRSIRESRSPIPME